MKIQKIIVAAGDKPSGCENCYLGEFCDKAYPNCPIEEEVEHIDAEQTEVVKINFDLYEKVRLNNDLCFHGNIMCAFYTNKCRGIKCWDNKGNFIYVPKNPIPGSATDPETLTNTIEQ